MRLTTFSDHALRALRCLPLHPGRLVTIAKIAAAFGVSANRLMVAQLLAANGVITTSRGKHGGLRLARPAARITLGVIIRRTEPNLVMAPCFEPGGVCVIQSGCRLAGVLDKALAAFTAVLDTATLADLTADPAARRQLLRANSG